MVRPPRAFSSWFETGSPHVWRGWTIILGSILILLVVLAFWVVPPVTVPDEGFKNRADLLKAQNDVRTAALQVIAGLVLAAGLVLTARSVGLTARSIEVSRESQVTERFSRSVEQLGHASQEVRIGGIYALERIARDSESDRQTVLEVVTAYTRRRAQRPDADDGWRRVEFAVQNTLAVKADVVAAITVLRRWEWGHADPLDLRFTELPNVDLLKANLVDALFIDANLAGAELSLANLREAVLDSVDAPGARFVEADLSRAHLSRAHLSEAILQEANLSRANLVEASLTNARLAGAIVTGADLSKADLTGADLTGADLTGADLTGARYTKGERGTQWPNDYDPDAAGALLVTD